MTCKEINTEQLRVLSEIEWLRMTFLVFREKHKYVEGKEGGM